VHEIRPVLVIAYDELIREIAKHPQNIYNISPRRFEEIIAYILEQFGFTVDLTAQTRDGGSDILAVTKDTLGITTSYIVECKRYAKDNKVGIATARAIYGVKAAQRKDHAIIATTSFFTRDAVTFSRNPEVINLHLRDFNSVIGWINEVTQESLPLRRDIVNI
jgi:restriction system protein